MSWTTSLCATAERKLLDTAGRRALLLDLRAKLRDLALEGPLVHEVRIRVRPEESRQVVPVGRQLTALPIEREQLHSTVLSGLGLHGAVGHDRVERQLHSQESSRG